MRALIVSGAGRYADPWHPFPDTSPLIAGILGEAGFSVAVSEDVEGSLADLEGVDLLVVNAGDPWNNSSEAVAPPATEGLAQALANGMGVLALHCAIASLRDYPDWAAATGAIWIPGASHHPPFGDATITGLSFPDGQKVENFELVDERYCGLQRIGASHVVAEHPGDARPEPTAWVREYGGARVAVDVLGHDARSYASPGHRDLVRRLASWAAKDLPT